MKLEQVNCHICGQIKRYGTPTYCPACRADFVNPDAETRISLTFAQKEAGGVQGNLIQVFLTNQRLFFIKMPPATGRIFGISLRTSEDASYIPTQESGDFVSIFLSDISSISEENLGFLRGQTRFTVHTKDGGAYSLSLFKKEGRVWRETLEQCLTSDL